MKRKKQHIIFWISIFALTFSCRQVEINTAIGRGSYENMAIIQFSPTNVAFELVDSFDLKIKMSQDSTFAVSKRTNKRSNLFIPVSLNEDTIQVDIIVSAEHYKDLVLEKKFLTKGDTLEIVGGGLIPSDTSLFITPRLREYYRIKRMNEAKIRDYKNTYDSLGNTVG